MHKSTLAWVITITIIMSGFITNDLTAKKRRRRSRKGTIVLHSSSLGASAYLDGKKWGEVPLKPLKVKPGRYRLKVQKLGFLEYKRKIVVKPGKTLRINADLLPVMTVLDIKTSIKGAKIKINGVAKGKAPSKFELKPGNYAITVTADGYLPFEKKLTLKTLGKAYSITAQLEKDQLAGIHDPALAALPLAGPEDNEVEALPLEPVEETPQQDLLALEPLPDLPLEVPPPDKEEKTQEEDPLALEPLSLEPLAPNLLQTQNNDSAFSADNSVTASGKRQWGRGPEWWNQWWVWSATGAVITSAVLIAVFASKGDSGGDGIYGTWNIGSGNIDRALITW